MLWTALQAQRALLALLVLQELIALQRLAIRCSCTVAVLVALHWA